MTRKEAIFREVTNAARSRDYGGWILLCALLTGTGAVAFLIAVLGSNPQRAWQAYLINFVFWTGMACGSLMLAVTLVLSKAIWGRSIKRLAEAPGAFLPVAFVLFWALYFGREHLFPWIHEPVPEKALWLNVVSFFTREGLVLLALSTAGLLFLYHSIRPDLDAFARGALPEPATENLGRHGRRQMIYANVYGLFYAFLLTILAFDLIMSLDPHWYSTLFGAYYFVGSFFTGLTVLMIIISVAHRTGALQKFIMKKQLHNVGKLMMAFCLLTADFFYVQFFVIWYGNIPEETHFVIQRLRAAPWEHFVFVVLLMAFVIPFIVLLFRRIKMMPRFMIGLSIFILAGMWLEKFMLVTPSIWPGKYVPLGWIELLITLGFLGIMGLSILLFLGRYPLLPVGDPMFMKNIESVFPASVEEHA